MCSKRKVRKRRKYNKVAKVKVMELPADCLGEIVCHFQGDVTTLYSCILVNRLWCENAVRLLWRDPFRKINESITTSNDKVALIETYVRCLDLEDKRKLCLKNNYLFDILLKKQGHDVQQKQQPPPTFNYIEFLRHLSIDGLYNSVCSWIYYKRSIIRQLSFTEKDIISLCCLLHKKFMFDALSIDLNLNSNHWPSYFGRVNKLVQLKELIIFAPMPNWSIFSNLSKYVKKLQRLEIYLLSYPSTPYEAKSIANFIQIQEELVHFKLIYRDRLLASSPILKKFNSFLSPRINDLDGSNTNNNLFNMLLRNSLITDESRCLPIFLDSLNTKLKTLNHLEFSGISFKGDLTLNLLSNCFKSVESLELNKLPLLHKFDFSPTANENFENFLSLIARTKNLKEICIYNITDLSSFLYGSIIENIISYCPNINKLSLPLRREDLPNLLKLLKNCRKLKALIIFDADKFSKKQPWSSDDLGDDNGNDDNDSNESNKSVCKGYNNDNEKNDVSGFLPQFGSLLPDTLKHLEIESPWWFTAGSLESFLINSKAPLEILKFKNSHWIINNQKYLLIVEFYLNDTLKDKNIGPGKNTQLQINLGI
ncbi:15328_t:CDS:2 [Entrophospora sp. SA101]|nr:15328_t:CDS:2 [Entrophospora sp. SA101]